MVEDSVSGFAKRICEYAEEYLGKCINYVELRNAIDRFIRLNPNEDFTRIDWAGVWDPELTYHENIENLSRAYPMYKWFEAGGIREEDVERARRERICSIVRELDEDEVAILLDEIRREFPEIAGYPDEHRRTPAVAAEIQEPQMAEAAQQRARVEAAPAPKIVVDLAMLAKYPWLEEARGFVRAYTFGEIPEKVIHRARDRVLEALERGVGIIPRLENPFAELLSFPVAKAIVSTIGDDWLKRRWSLAEAARCERLLYSEPQHVFDYLLGRIGICVEKCGEEDQRTIYWTRVDYRVGLRDYLRIAGELLREPEWKLVNMPVHRGWVYLSRARLTRIVRQYLYAELYRSFERTPRLRTVPDNLSSAISDIIGRLQEIRSRWRPIKASGGIPPCIQAIRERLADAGHAELFTYAAYLLNKGYGVDDVVKELSLRPDFDERIARYQVEHIAGLRGSRTRYRPPSCSTMRALGLCVKNGELCPRSARSPLEF